MPRATTISPRTIRKLIFLGLIFIAQSSFAQRADSLTQRYDSIAKTKLSRLDSTSDRVNKKIDDTQTRINNILNPNFDKLASRVNRRKLQPDDTLAARHELDSLKGSLSQRIDSLRSLNLPADQYTRKLDSLKQIGPKKYIDLVNGRADQWTNDIGKRADRIENKINQPLEAFKKNVDIDAKIPPELQSTRLADVTKDPLNINLPDNPVSNLPNTNSLDVKSFNNPVDQLKIDKPAIESPGQLQTAQEQFGKVSQATDKLQSYQEDVRNIGSGDLNDVKELPKTLEQKAGSIDEVKTLQEQTGEIGKANEMLNQAKDTEALKKMAKEQMVKQSINHFKGKEQVLQQAMDKMTKLKSRYDEVSSLKDLLKDPPNPLKGKPLIERIVPGLTFQVQKMGNINVDINPNVAYRFTPRINAGIGWNERLSFTKWNQLSEDGRIFGPRVFGTFSFKKGFSVKAEIENMNTLVPVSRYTSDGSRMWVWSAFVGLKKDYKFIGKVKGNVQLLYNLYDDHDNSPYADRFSIRTGFEFPMKKREKPALKP